VRAGLPADGLEELVERGRSQALGGEMFQERSRFIREDERSQVVPRGLMDGDLRAALDQACQANRHDGVSATGKELDHQRGAIED
jgi:hypothetical protein